MKKAGHRSRNIGRIAAGLAAVAGMLAGGASPTQAASDRPVPVTSFSYTSETGHDLGKGAAEKFRDPAVPITIGGTTERVQMTVEVPDRTWRIRLQAPTGETLRPGVFRNAEATPPLGRAPGLDLSASTSGCSEVYGQFTINQFATDESGAVTLLDASFTHRCGAADGPALKGVVKYRALPLSFAYSSDEGDWVGKGTSGTYKGATSLFSVSSWGVQTVFHVKGNRSSWSVMLMAPQGETLQAGRTYQAGSGGDALATLNFSGNGRACNGPEGEFTVHRLIKDENARVTGLWVTFTQRCQGSTAESSGTVRYYA
ncbi:hypothetical protein ACFVOK_18505 [Streptomyces sp. NPDC057798]|uniref:hypothetical protein n=1 Tax=Streptomyces sp. NPDC057798 TaxID=3346252 RepID=UPI0036860657